MTALSQGASRQKSVSGLGFQRKLWSTTESLEETKEGERGGKAGMEQRTSRSRPKGTINKISLLAVP